MLLLMMLVLNKFLQNVNLFDLPIIYHTFYSKRRNEYRLFCNAFIHTEVCFFVSSTNTNKSLKCYT